MSTLDTAALAGSFMGDLIAPDHGDYDAERQVWNPIARFVRQIVVSAGCRSW